MLNYCTNKMDKYQRKKIKLSDRVAQSIAGIVFIIFFSLMTLFQIMLFIHNSFITLVIIHIAMLFVFATLTAWSVRFTYRGIKGYKIVPTNKQKEIEKQKSLQREKYIDKYIALASYIGGLIILLCGLLLLGYQVVVYLQGGEWIPYALFDLFSYIISEQSSNWLNKPDSWFGLHKIIKNTLNFIPASLFAIIIGFLLIAAYNIRR